MRPQAQHPRLQGWQRLAGTWATEATHPALPGTVVTGQATFEWLEDQRFLMWRSHYDHPQIPGARRLTPDDLRGALQLYVARTRSCEVHIAARHPVHGRGADTRQQADPTSTR